MKLFNVLAVVLAVLAYEISAGSTADAPLQNCDKCAKCGKRVKPYRL